MTFLAPWALAIGAAGAVGLVLLHLVALQRPAAFMLPTTRFIPDQRTLVSRAATRPRDLLLLILRVLMLLAAAAAFARPVLTPARGARARVVLLDHSRAVGDPGAAAARARALLDESSAAALVPFDTAAREASRASLDSLAATPRVDATASLSAALIAARRSAVRLAQQADSVELIVVSPLAAGAIDAATSRIRAEWPGAIRIERTALAADPARIWRLERTIPLDDPLGPAVSRLPAQGDGRSVRLLRGAVTAADSAFARAGGSVVRWDSIGSVRPTPQGLAVGEDVIVAPLARIALPAGGTVIARWADGTPAATQATLGSGCIRHVGVGVPLAGDLALRPSFQRVVRALLVPCGVAEVNVAADSSAVAALAGPTKSPASAELLRRGTELPSPLARWLLGLALALALAELVVRAKLPPDIT